MSDVSQGPGWWQASDGKWYPPEQAPGTPTPPPPTAPPPGYAPPGYTPPAGPPTGPPAGYGAPGAPAYGAPAYGPPGYAAPAEDLKGARAGARAIDVLVIIVIAFIVNLPFGVTAAGTADDDVSLGKVLIAAVLVNLISLAYELLMVSTQGATLGKMAVGLKIVKTDGSKLDLLAAARRHSPTLIPRLVSIIPVVGLLGSLGVLVVFIINVVMVLSSGRSLYDQVGETQVVRAR